MSTELALIDEITEDKYPQIYGKSGLGFYYDKVKTEVLSEVPDLHAFLLLDDLFPNPDNDMIAAAEHDKYWLDVDGEAIAKLTDDQILELVRCGVIYDSDVDSLAMFA